MPGTKTIVNDGNLYETGDLLTLTGGGVGANIQISELGSGEITEVLVDTAGQNYQIGIHKNRMTLKRIKSLLKLCVQ